MRLTADKRGVGELTDELLMQRLSAHDDHTAFDELYRRHARRLAGFFLRMLGYDRDRADDFTQELFCKLYANRRRYDGGQNLTTWLYAMAYNLCKNEYRHEDVVRAYENYCATHFEEAVLPADGMDIRRMKQELIRCVQALPHEQREVFLLRYVEQLSTTETASIVGCPEGTVKSRLFKALAVVTEKMKMYND